MSDENPIDSVLSAIKKESDIFKRSALRDQLIFYVNHLLLNDFSRLVQWLYVIDVNEEQLKMHLAQNTGKDSAAIIADLLIERHAQKEKDRSSTPPVDSIDDEEKW